MSVLQVKIIYGEHYYMNIFIFRRLLALLESTSGDIVCGGDSDESTLYIAPTVIANVSPDDKIMQVSCKA